ncbi:hypothetical protein PG985_008066 [Apiospora marii]|uniref:Uncharacterized protein n=1 Tax=Apiospora marii TaxID=335849 RepID=A0ABR1R9G3_9PEZI
MPYPQANYQRLVYGEYPVAKYRSACQAAVRMALVKEAWWKDINPITFTTVGSGHLLRNKSVVVRVKLRSGHAKARLDVFALEDALEGAAESDIDMNCCTHKCKTDTLRSRRSLADKDAGDFQEATLKRCDRWAEANYRTSPHDRKLRNSDGTKGKHDAPESIRDLMNGEEHPLAQYFVYTNPSYEGVHSTGEYRLEPHARHNKLYVPYKPGGNTRGLMELAMNASQLPFLNRY